MCNVETKSNGRKDMHEPVTMRILKKEVNIYRADNERIMKDKEEILQILNILQKKVNKYSRKKKEVGARKVETSISHDRRDYHGGSRCSRNSRRHHHHHSPGNLTRREYACLRSERNPCLLSYIRKGDMVNITCKGS
jgi:hypothetical protein